MPAGKAQQFRKDMEKLVEDLQAAITHAFEGDEYEKQKRTIAQQVGEKQEAKLDRAPPEGRGRPFQHGAHSRRAGLRPLTTAEGETMSREQYEALPPEEQKRIDDGLEVLNEELQEIMRLVRQDERGGRDAMRELDREVTTFAAKHLIDEMCERWCDVPADGRLPARPCSTTCVENADDFKKSDDETPGDVHGHPREPEAEGRGSLPQVQDQRAGGQLRPRRALRSSPRPTRSCRTSWDGSSTRPSSAPCSPISA